MELKRKVARGVAIVAVAAAAGHFVQSVSHGEQGQDEASKQPVPTGVETIAARPEAAEPTASFAVKPGVLVATGPADTALSDLAGTASVTQETTPVEAAADPALTDQDQPDFSAAEATLGDPAPVAGAAAVAAPTETAEPAATDSAAADCTMALDLAPVPGGFVSVVLTAPCNPGERVVLSHAGLAVTAKTTASGAIFAQLPALTTEALVGAKFPDGAHIASSVAVPEVAALRRFGIQWQGVSGFGIHALEGGAGYGQPGDVSAANPRTPLAGVAPGGGYLTTLGDASVDLPLLAEVYTWPARPGTRVDILVEAAVTPATCDTDLLGETLNTLGGATRVTDLTVAMPGCDATGDYLVLKNLATDPKLAAAN